MAEVCDATVTGRRRRCDGHLRGRAGPPAPRHRRADDHRVERGEFTSSACGISYWLGGTVHDRDALIARTPQQHRDRGIDVRLHHEVVGLDTDRGIHVRVRDLDGGRESTEGYD